jgi:mannose-6-phosphate isomerase-like protein (cupin superfamily)
MIKRIDKPWGWEEILEENQEYVLKRIFMYKGHRCSLQYHKFKQETIYVLYGDLTIIINDNSTIYPTNSTVTIRPFDKHRMEAVQNGVMYLECSTPHLDDVVRIEDDYQRI